MLHDTSPSGTIRFYFPSMQAVQRYIEATKRTWSVKQSIDQTPEMGWDLNAGYQGALKLAKDGWRDGGAELKEMLEALPPITVADDICHDVAGFMPDVGRYCAGIPDNMYREADGDYGSKAVVSLFVPVNATASVSAKYMRNYGLALARYIDEMEAGGRQVELLAGIVSEVSGKRLAHVWTVKQAGTQMDYGNIAFAVGHPAVFRRFGFALRERSPVRTDYGYGYSQDAKLDDIINADPGLIILNGMKDADRIARTPEAAIASVRKQIDAALADREAGTAD